MACHATVLVHRANLLPLLVPELFLPFVLIFWHLLVLFFVRWLFYFCT